MYFAAIIYLFIPVWFILFLFVVVFLSCTFESIKHPLLITILHPLGQLIIIYSIMLIPEGSRFDPVWSVIACVYFSGVSFSPTVQRHER